MTMSNRMEFKGPNSFSKMLLLAAAYYASARLGLQLQFEETQATPVWPPSGIAVAALLLFGLRISGGVFLGAFLANMADFYVKSKTPLPFGAINLLQHFADHPEHVAVSATIGIGNMLEAIAGSYLVRRFSSGSDISDNIRSVFFFILATLLCCVISSTIGVSSLFAASILPYPLLSTVWLTWWLGDATGILILTPLVLVWSHLGAERTRVQPWGRMSAGLLLLMLISQFTFNGWLDLALSNTQAYTLVPVLLRTQAYMLIPVLLWIEFTVGNVAGTLGIAVTSVTAVLGTIHGHGPFVGSSQNESLLVLQGFVGIASVTVLLLDAALSERWQALTALSRARDDLELRVTERTAELRDVNDELSLQIRERNTALERLEREIAERRRTEEILRQTQKMEAVGQLTGGIAHDFNNLLQIIFGNLDALRRRFADGDIPGDAGDFHRLTAGAIRGAERAGTLTRQLLAFSRRQALQPKPIDVNNLVAGMSDLLRRTLGETIVVETVPAGDLWRVSADANQLESALLNLAVNARDAMPKGGQLTIETANGYLDDAYAAAHDEVAPGHYVIVAVSDTGVGMSTEVIAKAFDPFFTTKKVGQGTGLGLSQVYGFVKQSGGHVKIRSDFGKGTTVKIHLPRLSADNTRIESGAKARNVPAGERSETILVVEDDEDLRAHSAATLRELG